MALADHRKKYPDWRFRTTANTPAKSKDGPKRKNNKKARGEADKKVKDREKRCDRIADLLAAGKTGADLEKAIEKFDHELQDELKIEEDGCSVFAAKPQESVAPPAVPESPTDVGMVGDVKNHALSPDLPSPVSLPEVHEISDGSPNVRFCTPLTSMFRRSSSAPAAHAREAASETFLPSAPNLGRRESISTFSYYADSQSSPALSDSVGHGVDTRVAGKVDPEANVAAMRHSDWEYQPSPCTFFESPNPSEYVYPRWNEVSLSLRLARQ